MFFHKLHVNGKISVNSVFNALLSKAMAME